MGKWWVNGVRLHKTLAGCKNDFNLGGVLILLSAPFFWFRYSQPVGELAGIFGGLRLAPINQLAKQSGLST